MLALISALSQRPVQTLTLDNSAQQDVFTLVPPDDQDDYVLAPDGSNVLLDMKDDLRLLGLLPEE